MPDEQHMDRALDLAERGRATVRPNPLVGCVLVRDGEIVGEGWHERAGGPHAEVTALHAAGAGAHGATAYVTLEPCGHIGRTPPCVDALVEAGVRRVVFAAADPVHGGAERLRQAGVDVSAGVRESEAMAQNELFFHLVRTKRVHVTVKIAQTLDGRVAARDGTSQWITSEEARRAGHELRASVDGVVVGSGTVLADDPRLDARDVPTPLGQPRPIVLDGRGRVPANARAIRAGSVVITTAASSDAWRDDVSGAGADVAVVGPGAHGGVDPLAALVALRERDVAAVLTEGGPRVTGSLIRAGLVDRLVVFVAPSLIGADGLPSVLGPGAATLTDAWGFSFEEISRIGPDVRLVARPRGRTADSSTTATPRSRA